MTAISCDITIPFAISATATTLSCHGTSGMSNRKVMLFTRGYELQ